ncbi:hypothetical protein SGLAM104S_06758 [Streptomyces glaucescens]
MGENGDVLQYSDGHPRSGRAQSRVVRTASELARGVAAALLAQMEGKNGVKAFGGFYGVTAEAGTTRVQDGKDGAVGVAASDTGPARKGRPRDSGWAGADKGGTLGDHQGAVT